MNKYIVILLDGTKFEVPTSLTMTQFKANLAEMRIGYKQVTDAAVKPSGWDRSEVFATRKEAVDYQLANKKGTIKPQGRGWIVVSPKS